MPDAAAIELFLRTYSAVIVIGIIAFMFIQVFYLSMAATLMQAVPIQFRASHPAMVYLALLPIFGEIWSFLVFPRISSSFQRYFGATGRDGKFGDCGSKYAIWHCVCRLLTYIPLLGVLFGSISVIMLILFFVKGFEMKRAVGVTTQSNDRYVSHPKM